MKRHLGWVVASALSILGAASASAADLAARPYTKAPPPVPAPIYNWTGFYLGVNGGGAWADTHHTDISGITTGTFHQSGGLVGGTVGFNWQAPANFVVGVEGDWDWADVNGSITSALCAGGTCFTKLRDFATVRGRVGYAWNQWLFYGTGGAAFGEVRAGQDSCAGALVICGTNTRTGWTAGAGFEVLFAPNWSAKLEYLYFDLGNKVQYTPVLPVSVSERGNMVRAGVNYHFNWGSPLVARY